MLTGPCSTPYVGKISEAEYVIKLHGVRELYSEGDFEIQGSNRTTWIGAAETQGCISIDRNTRTVRIEVYLRGKPFKLNGRHRYRVEST